MILWQVLPILSPADNEHDNAATSKIDLQECSSKLGQLLCHALTCTSDEILQLLTHKKLELHTFHVLSSQGQFVHVYKVSRQWAVNCNSKLCLLKNKVSSLTTISGVRNLCPHLEAFRDPGWASEDNSVTVIEEAVGNNCEESIQDAAAPNAEVLSPDSI